MSRPLPDLTWAADDTTYDENSDRKNFIAYICEFLVWLFFKDESEMLAQQTQLCTAPPGCTDAALHRLRQILRRLEVNQNRPKPKHAP